ncbi:MAG: NDP-sugar synthase [Methanophagales archaeon ANME-1-THS]|nr:MAG: NDP-sugar synthase [Methanophagales archaeon ANME-1-THS]
MKAVILAGGFGTRLRPLTLTKPKPMIPLVNKPVIEHVVDYLVSYGLNDIVVTTTLFGEMIVEHFRNRGDVHLSFPPEPVPLGTAGSVKNAGLDKEEEPFVVIQGDNITDLDLRGLLDFHFASGGLVTIALTHVDDPWNYGIAQLGDNGCIERFHEKPDKGGCFSDLASTGIYVIDPKAMEFVPERIPFDFAKDLFHLLHAKKKGSMFGYELDAGNFWADVGQPEGFMNAMEWILKKARRDVIIGDNVEITSSGIIGPTVIGNSVVVEENCTIGPHTVLFDEVYIARNSNLEQCLIGERTITGANACVRDAIIGAHCELGKDVEVCSGKIWPYVTIPDSTTVDSAIKRYVCFNGGEKYGGNGENEDLLRTVPDEEAFYFNMRKGGKIVHTGFVAHNLKEFLEIFEKIDLKAIEYHLREGCNDFAAWIRDVFRHNKLAEEVAEMRWWWPRKKLISRILKCMSGE